MFGKLKSRADWQIALAMTGALRVFYSAAAAACLPFLHPDPVVIHSNQLTENLPAQCLEFGSGSTRCGICTSHNMDTTSRWR
jgi:hypothetical protein